MRTPEGESDHGQSITATYMCRRPSDSGPIPRIVKAMLKIWRTLIIYFEKYLSLTFLNQLCMHVFEVVA